MSGHILVDFDCTLAIYPARGLGDPIPKMVRRVKEWLSQGIEVRIFTARASEPELIPAVEEWCVKHIGVKLMVTNQKDFSTIEIWDDRAIRIKSNTGEIDNDYFG